MISILTFKLLLILKFIVCIYSLIHFHIIILFTQSIEKVLLKKQNRFFRTNVLFKIHFFLRRYSDLHYHLMYQMVFFMFWNAFEGADSFLDGHNAIFSWIFWAMGTKNNYMSNLANTVNRCNTIICFCIKKTL